MKMKGRQKRGRNRSPRASLLLSIRLFVCAFAVLQILHPNMVHGQEGQDEETAKDTGYGGEVQEKVDSKKVQEYVKYHQNQDTHLFNHDQLEQWFIKNADADRFKPWDYPRAFPFCVTRNQIVQGHKDTIYEQTEENRKKPVRVPKESHLLKFERYFHGVELRRKKFYQFDPKLDSTIHNKTFVESIEFSRINTPEPDMVNLRQWVHITVKMAEPMVGLYMQSIVGPFGLPFGEFSVEFNCSDSTVIDIAEVGELSYCSYRPRTNIYHPSAYVAFDETISETGLDKDGQLQLKGRKEFHVHFKWFDLSCMETPYVQFLMLIIKNRKGTPAYGIDYVAQMSPVFLNTDFDSKDGSPYPYYPGFRDNMFCFLKSQDELKDKYANINLKPSGKVGSDNYHSNIAWREAHDVIRVQPNEEYDDCILYEKGVHETKDWDWDTKRNEETYECGPGPFRCDVDYAVQNVSALRQTLVTNEVSVSKCYPCAAPECVKSGFLEEYCGFELPPVNDLEGEIHVLTDLDDNSRVRAHGVAAILAFLFFIPIGHFVGRFYKEVMGKRLFGNGPWIFVHIMCSMLAIAAVWSSMGPMIPTLANIRARRKACKKIHNGSNSEAYDTCLEGYEIRSPHTVTGLIAYILIHFVPIFGFIRPPSNKLRFLMSAVHSHLGYFTYGLGAVSVFIAINKPRCIDTKVFCITLLVLPLIFSGIAFALDMMSDKRLGVRPGRKQWPVLEQLQLESRGPLEFPKLILLAIFLVLMTIVWLLTLVSLHVAESQGDALLKGLNDFKGGKAAVLGKLQGLFGDCN